MELINKNAVEHLAKGKVKESWVSVTCDAIGSSDESCGPPPSAVEAVKSMIVEYANLSKHDIQVHSNKYPSRTKVDAQLLEAWRSAAGDPDRWVYKWLRDGAPTGQVLRSTSKTRASSESVFDRQICSHRTFIATNNSSVTTQE